MSERATRHIVVMGVSGCGKTTVATGLAEYLDYRFAEGDAFHPAANIAKMSAGTPLTDDDRWPWLRSVGEWTAERAAQGVSTVVSCSALKRAYRDMLRSACPMYFVHLTASRELLTARMEARQGHFMPLSLLGSQLATIEPLESDEAGCQIPVEGSPQDVLNRVIAALR